MATAFIAGYTLSGKTTIGRESNTHSSISASGTMRFVDLGAQTYWIISPVFEVLTEAEKETLVDWLVTNETTEIALVVGSETYNGYIDPTQEMASEPYPEAPNLWVVTFAFRGIKQ